MLPAGARISLFGTAGLSSGKFWWTEMDHSVLVNDEVPAVVSVERHVDGLIDHLEPLGYVFFDHRGRQRIRRLL